MIAKSLFALLSFLSVNAWAAGEHTPDWYYPEWLATAPHAPVFQVRDTVNKYGRYARGTKDMGPRRDNDYKNVPEAR